MIKEVTPSQRLEGTLRLPPDKSISHRAAMFAALHRGVSRVDNFSPAADPQSTLSCLQRLGVEIKREDETIWVHGVGRDGLAEPGEPLDCGNSGTTMRLLSGIVGGAGISCTLTGDESLSSRTMKRIVEPLRKMGIDIGAREGNYAPLAVKEGGKVEPMDFELPIASAQLKSCVLLAGLFGESPTNVLETLPSRDHTERLLNLPVREEGGKTVISSHRQVVIPQQSYRVPNDFSAAAFWLVAGSIHPRAAIQLDAVGINPSRTAAMDLLRRMGADIRCSNKSSEGPEPVADITIESGSLQPVNINEEVVPNCIDEIPVLAIAMLFADGVSVIRGAGELRHKETNRLSALADMLDAAGARFEEYDDGVKIYGDPAFRPEPAEYESFHDHRIAMAAAVLALMSKGTSAIRDAECTAISYPGFWDDLHGLTN